MPSNVSPCKTGAESPRAWQADEIREADWRVALPPQVRKELLELATELAGTGCGPSLMMPCPTDLPATRAFTDAIRRRLHAELGFCVISDFPLSVPAAVMELAYWILGLHLGRPVSQDRSGTLLCRVEDAGAQIANPSVRGHKSREALPFHCDRADLIGLLCVRQAARGGRSLIGSSRRLRDILAAEAPEAVAVLSAPFPQDRRDEQPPGSPPWIGMPVFSEHTAPFSARYVRRFILDSQRHQEAPRLSPAQIRAMEAVESVLHRPGWAVEMTMRPGDVQLINNCELLHARTAFEGTDDTSRLLLRLWLAVAESPPLPAAFADFYVRTAAGSYRGGVWPDDGPPAELIGRPIRELEVP